MCKAVLQTVELASLVVNDSECDFKLHPEYDYQFANKMIVSSVLKKNI